MKRKSIIAVTILSLTIGFADISTTLIINGSTNGETNFETQDKLYLLSAQEV